MTVRQNFTGATLEGQRLVVRGTSPPPADTIIDIVVGIDIGGSAEHVHADQLSEDWTATFELESADVTAGQQVLAFGVEIRHQPFLAITWAETLTVA